MAEKVSKVTLVPSQVVNKIDYFKIPDDKLRDEHNFDAQKITLDLSNQHLSVSLLEQNRFDPESINTVVFNLPTNTGKTTTCYTLIEQYANRLNYLVLVCSPYIKLVNKDHEELHSRGVNVFNYQELSGPDPFRYRGQTVDTRVHVMTVNCLLRNPGDDNYGVSANKLDYIHDLISYAEFWKLKMVIFIDEIHESVHNFSKQLLPHLVLLNRYIHKIFVASATHTVSSYGVIKHLGQLTNGSIQIFEADRVQRKKTAANLYLHVVNRPYGSTNLKGLNLLEGILKKCHGKKINILCAYKKLATALHKLPENHPLYKYLDGFDLSTGDVKEPIDLAKNNIGTTFKTGINIDDPANVYIIVLPFFYPNDTPPSKDYGIFENVLPSVVQALGRQRNGGECHIIMSRPPRLIKNTVLHSQTGRKFKYKVDEEPYEDQNSLLNSTVDDYRKLLKNWEIQIDLLRKGYSHNTVTDVISYYPSLQDYLITDAQSYLTNNHISAGQSLTPYLLWAATNHQFCNVRLKKVYWHYTPEKIIELTDDYAQNVKNLIRYQHDIFVNSDVESPMVLFERILDTVCQKNNSEKIIVNFRNDSYSCSKVELTQEIKRTLFVTTIFHKYGTDLPKNLKKTGSDVSFESAYIQTMLLQVKDLPASSPLVLVYAEMLEWREKFYQIITRNIRPSSTYSSAVDILDSSAYTQITQEDVAKFLEICKKLESNDPFYKKGLGNISVVHSDPVTLQKKIFNLCRGLFTNIRSEDWLKSKGSKEKLTKVPSDWKRSEGQVLF